MSATLRPLVLTGGPAVGKTSTGRALATARVRAAFIDGDDIRQLVVAGATTLWSGPEGAAQHALATRNTAAVTNNFVSDGYEVVVADFVTTATCEIYRSLLPQAFVVHLSVSRGEARRRAATRHLYLTEDEFELLHDVAQDPPPVDLVLDVDDLSRSAQTAALRSAWETASN